MVVDDSRIVQIQMEKILSDTDFEIVACCGSGEEALKKYEEYMPDVVTMDI
ncbi:MAG: response regulator, partial [Agathobaculum sp.]